MIVRAKEGQRGWRRLPYLNCIPCSGQISIKNHIVVDLVGGRVWELAPPIKSTLARVPMRNNWAQPGIIMIAEETSKHNKKFWVRVGIKKLVFYYSKKLEFRHIIFQNFVDESKKL